jgi:hypothetical protein
MPKARKRPTKFVSDDEDDGADDVVTSKAPTPPDSDVDDTPPAPKQQPGRLSRVYTLEEDDDKEQVRRVNRPVKRAETLPIPPVRVEVKKSSFDIAEFVSILSSANAHIKGRIDETGRYELEFEVNQERRGVTRAHRDRTPSPDSERTKGKSSPTSGKSKPGRQIGWIR